MSIAGRAQRRHQHIALRMQPGALVIEHAADDHLLHQTVVGGARGNDAVAKQVSDHWR